MKQQANSTKLLRNKKKQTIKPGGGGEERGEKKRMEGRERKGNKVMHTAKQKKPVFKKLYMRGRPYGATGSAPIQDPTSHDLAVVQVLVTQLLIQLTANVSGRQWITAQMPKILSPT